MGHWRSFGWPRVFCDHQEITLPEISPLGCPKLGATLGALFLCETTFCQFLQSKRQVLDEHNRRFKGISKRSLQPRKLV